MAEPDTKELDALLDSLNSSAERFQTLWFSFLGLTLYLAIAALATTHRNLLLGEPQTLPVLNIKVELLPFYVIAPLLYLVFHFYLLMMLVLLARTGAEFEKRLRSTLPEEADRERYRAGVENALFLQLLVGMKGERSGVNAFLLGLIALITVVLAPLATLILMQMMFLPYHHLRITWWHRAVVVADLILIVVMTYRCFFPRGVRKAPLVFGALGRKPRWATAMAFCALLAVALSPLVDWLSFRQGRWAGEPRPSSFQEWEQWIAGKRPPLPDANPDYDTTEKGVVFGLFPDRLELGDETIVGEKTLEETKKEMTSRGDFVSTLKFDGRDLQAAVLRRADLRGVSLLEAVLRGADLKLARLDGATLIFAQLQGAVLSDADLQGAVLRLAQLQGADLLGTRLREADLESAGLQGASLDSAHLQGAYLSGAELQGADLHAAQLQGAYLGSAGLQGADLADTQLQGADLRFAQLQGANFDGAQLQGAVLSEADLADSSFAENLVFRTNIARANLVTAAIGSVYADRITINEKGGSEPLTPRDIDKWMTAGTQFARANLKDGIVKRFDCLKPDFQVDPDEVKWSGLHEASLALDPEGAQHRRRLAKFLGDLAGEPANAPQVARNLIRQEERREIRVAALGDQFATFRARLEDGRKTPEKCLGVAGFTEDDWLRLEAIRPARDRQDP